MRNAFSAVVISTKGVTGLMGGDELMSCLTRDIISGVKRLV